MRKVAITGVAGFIGGTLCKELLDQDIEVYGIDIDKNRLEKWEEYKNFTPIIANFSNYNELPQMIEARDIDVFYHFAWQGGFVSALKDYKIQFENAIASCDALMAAVSMECKKFVYAGTVNEYEVKKYINMEYCEPRNTCIYASAKLASEMICKALAFNHNINYSAGLIPMIYGKGNKSKQLVNVVINDLLNNQAPKLIAGNNLYDLIDVKDVARAFIAIGKKGKSQKSYYIGHQVLRTFRDWITDIRDFINPEIELKFGEYPDNLNMDYSLIDLLALYNDTGFKCESNFRNGILETAEWVKKLGWQRGGKDERNYFSWWRRNKIISNN